MLYGNPDARLDFQVERIADPRFGDPGFATNLLYNGYRHRWGDLNEDGYMDAVVSVPARAYVYYGSAAGYTRFAPAQTEEFSLLSSLRGSYGGYSAHPSDIDGDGLAEVLIGNTLAPADPVTRANGRGRLNVYPRDPSTRLAVTEPSLTLGPPPSAAGFGAVVAPGDLNGDGYDDLVVGAAPYPETQETRATALLYVYHGGMTRWWQAPVTRIAREYAFEEVE